ncbi:hypothetical protein GOODEAATRI_032438 [Goodea atripinnis]|uniref:Uncharacterized protein n=1 Tax=Goodea atripinnis TaxID=208336 RepID=A0ABV0PJ33_9TELE
MRRGELHNMPESDISSYISQQKAVQGIRIIRTTVFSLDRLLAGAFYSGIFNLQQKSHYPFAVQCSELSSFSAAPIMSQNKVLDPNKFTLINAVTPDDVPT